VTQGQHGLILPSLIRLCGPRWRRGRPQQEQGKEGGGGWKPFGITRWHMDLHCL
ncbi:hypothetical protein NDU88_007851, partial [Pleurodeles waltl]